MHVIVAYCQPTHALLEQHDAEHAEAEPKLKLVLMTVPDNPVLDDVAELQQVCALTTLAITSVTSTATSWRCMMMMSVEGGLSLYASLGVVYASACG